MFLKKRFEMLKNIVKMFYFNADLCIGILASLCNGKLLNK